jgi:hypothetical protein
MSHRRTRWRALTAAGACFLVLAGSGCGPPDDKDDAQVGDSAKRLAYQAQQVGVALDVWHSSPRHDLATRFRPAMLKRAGIELDDGVRVRDYGTVRTGSTATHDDLWQLCVTAPDGSWVSYGERTTVQDFGTEGAACTFTGETHPEPPTFDMRGLAHGVYDTMKRDDPEAEPNLRVWGGGRTSGSNPKLRALVEERLPDGWATSKVDQRGWSAVQYCLTAPTGEWYYVRQSTVEEYGDSGRCRLDPDMPSLG